MSPSTDTTTPTAARQGERRAPTAATRGSILLVALVALVLVAFLSVAVGSKVLPLGTVWQALVHRDPVNPEHDIIWVYRVPRTGLAVTVGAALGVSGALAQAMTRNPLADPGLLGVNSGAACGVVLAIGTFGLTSMAGYLWFAFAGALLATAAVYLIGAVGRGPADPVRLVLAGMALSAVLVGVTNALSLHDPRAFDGMRNWTAGSVVGREWHAVWPVLPFIALGLVTAVAASRALNAVALGDDLARATGVNLTANRILVLISVTLLAGGATAIAGPVGFVGLMVPHVARWLVGPNQPWIVALSALLAAILLVASDVIGRVITRPGEVPVGVVTAFVGAPLLVVLIRRNQVREL
ncbi:iron chelate uptake ABC transporter family permease subunit [Yinghuangia sp. ASG 101]|uniref:FecCD family ABC transporter permease n=1 Tax=Yinghuangia sp. ASG 101 TaxID=2896848 RepID=UPI001E33BE3C|nr:iron chelate uptake ABC transporter family permease subunit [Yinghuangia sp. ASG 101]UGQ11401.1 iron chelate uptake ABC transporter family permease subunit [Yinghuangia sp. ASG 101]